jgi:cytochrome c biogenesis protein CcdA
MWTLWMGYLFGVVQGVRHAFEPDHLAAVSTIAADARSPTKNVFFAACWGTGHALMLVVVGGALFVLRRGMPERLDRVLELCVAAMLVVLGARALRKAFRRTGDDSGSEGGEETLRDGRRRWRLARRPLVIGVVHGLAGSGALTAIVASSYPSALTGLLFMLVYGLGAAAGMAALAGAVGVPLARAMRTRRGPPLLLGVTGAFSLVLGLVWGWPLLHAIALP